MAASLKLLAVLVTALASFSPATATPNLIELAQQLNLTTFVNAAKQTGLDRIINHEGRLKRLSDLNFSFSFAHLFL
jgi:uncharacterized surface protein with fasciclin (FAS1) repeats